MLLEVCWWWFCPSAWFCEHASGVLHKIARGVFFIILHDGCSLYACILQCLEEAFRQPLKIQLWQMLSALGQWALHLQQLELLCKSAPRYQWLCVWGTKWVRWEELPWMYSWEPKADPNRSRIQHWDCDCYQLPRHHVEVGNQPTKQTSGASLAPSDCSWTEDTHHSHSWLTLQSALQQKKFHFPRVDQLEQLQWQWRQHSQSDSLVAFCIWLCNWQHWSIESLPLLVAVELECSLATWVQWWWHRSWRKELPLSDLPAPSAWACSLPRCPDWWRESSSPFLAALLQAHRKEEQWWTSSESRRLSRVESLLCAASSWGVVHGSWNQAGRKLRLLARFLPRPWGTGRRMSRLQLRGGMSLRLQTLLDRISSSGTKSSRWWKNNRQKTLKNNQTRGRRRRRRRRERNEGDWQRSNGPEPQGSERLLLPRILLLLSPVALARKGCQGKGVLRTENCRFPAARRWTLEMQHRWTPHRHRWRETPMSHPLLAPADLQKPAQMEKTATTTTRERKKEAIDCSLHTQQQEQEEEEERKTDLQMDSTCRVWLLGFLSASCCKAQSQIHLLLCCRCWCRTIVLSCGRWTASSYGNRSLWVTASRTLCSLASASPLSVLRIWDLRQNPFFFLLLLTIKCWSFWTQNSKASVATAEDLKSEI